MNINFPRKKELYTKAIKWLEWKIRESGGTIENVLEFEKDITEFLDLCFSITTPPNSSRVTNGHLMGGATISSAPSLVETEKTNLKEIFVKHKVWSILSKQVFCLSITKRDVYVVDGYANAKKKVDYNKSNNTFSCSTNW